MQHRQFLPLIKDIYSTQLHNYLTCCQINIPKLVDHTSSRCRSVPTASRLVYSLNSVWRAYSQFTLLTTAQLHWTVNSSITHVPSGPKTLPHW